MGERSFVAFLQVSLFFGDVASLKGKRAELNRIKAWLHNRLGASVAEVGFQDTWQRSLLAVAVCAGSESGCLMSVDAMSRYFDERFPEGATIERRVLSWSDVEDLA